MQPHIEYAATVWDPHISRQKHSLEMVPRRAARWVTNIHHNTSSVSDMLHTLGWRSPKHRRATGRLCRPLCYSKSTMVLLTSHMILILSHTDTIHDPHVKQIRTSSQHTSTGLTLLNVLPPNDTKLAFLNTHESEESDY